jgi:hypothetical protein
MDVVADGCTLKDRGFSIPFLPIRLGTSFKRFVLIFYVRSEFVRFFRMAVSVQSSSQNSAVRNNLTFA